MKTLILTTFTSMVISGAQATTKFFGMLEDPKNYLTCQRISLSFLKLQRKVNAHLVASRSRFLRLKLPCKENMSITKNASSASSEFSYFQLINIRHVLLTNYLN